MKPDNDVFSARMAMWEKLVDLHIFHEDLKQKRLNYFYTFHLGAAAGYYILVLGSELSLLQACLAAGFALTAALHTVRCIQMDDRAALYIKTVKNQIRHLETQLAPLLDIEPMPYEGQFRVLNAGSHQLNVDFPGYVAVGLDEARAKAMPASQAEAWMLRYVKFCWFAATALPWIVLIIHWQSPSS